jgi:hypothetical protein
MKTQKFSGKLIAILIQDQVAKELPLISLSDPKVVELLNELQTNIQHDLKGSGNHPLHVENLVQNQSIRSTICRIIEVLIIPTFQQICDLIDDDTKISAKTNWKSRKKTILKNAMAWLDQLKTNPIDYSLTYPSLSNQPTTIEFMFRNIGLFGISEW